MSTNDIAAEVERRSSTPKLQGSLQKSYLNDFISQMADDILVIILSCLPIKDAVVTSIVSTRWRFLWRNLIQLNFDGSETLDKMSKDDCKMFNSELSNKYINQVNNVIKSYNHPKVQSFRIRFYLNNHFKGCIDEWVWFAANKKVELLELDLTNRHKFYYAGQNYNFPLRLSNRNISPVVKPVIVELVSLKQLILNKVNVSDTILQEFLSNSPHLETISIHRSRDLKHICVGGRALKLKHFEIVYCLSVQSIYLSDFDLVSFTFKGHQIDLRLSHLPKLKEVDMGQRLLGFCNNVFGQISSFNSSMQALSLKIHFSRELRPKFISNPLLPNVKKLRLRVSGRLHNGFLQLAFILDVCPNLETFTLEPSFLTKIYTRKTIDGPCYCHEHLKYLNIIGNYDDLLEFLSDFELVAYLISNVVALKKIVIDARTEAGDVATSKDISQNSEVGQKLESLKPQGVELVFL